MKLTLANQLAENLLSWLGPACLRIEIAGSIRRLAEEPGDIELVLIPDPKPPRPEFGRKRVFLSKVDELMQELVDEGSAVKKKDGPKYKQFRLVSERLGLPRMTEDISLDMFLVTPPAEWGVIYLLRTGPEHFSKWMVTQRAKGGALPDGYWARSGAIWRLDGEDELEGGVKVPMPEERDYFELCGMSYLVPSLRFPQWGDAGYKLTTDTEGLSWTNL